MRAWTYVWRRVTRLGGTPHAIALGCAAGVLASFTPFIGLHFAIAAVLALAIGGNPIAAALGTFFGNPLSFPLIWLSSYNFGGFLLGREWKSEVDIALPSGFWGGAFSDPGTATERFLDAIGPVFLPMLVGGLPLGLVFAIIAYFPAKRAVESLHERRRDRRLRGNKNASHGAPVGN